MPGWEARTVGVILIWVAGFILAPALLWRLRQGAWGPDSFDEVPPVPAWTRRALWLALILLAVGTVITVWSLL